MLRPRVEVAPAPASADLLPSSRTSTLTKPFLLNGCAPTPTVLRVTSKAATDYKISPHHGVAMGKSSSKFQLKVILVRLGSKFLLFPRLHPTCQLTTYEAATEATI